jgi:hypothetical protein
MNQIVAFLDILGTSTRVRAGEFDDSEILDFVNPVCLLAGFVPSLRCGVFSDSVTVSTAEDSIESMLVGLSYLFRCWISDGIFVRGGVATGEIVWVDMGKMDKGWRRLENLAFARVYGNGLLNAQEIEKGSGPGAVCFLSPGVSGLISRFNANLVLRGPVDVLAWGPRRTNQWAQHICSNAARRNHPDSVVGRQMAASAWYYGEMERLGLFTPAGLVPFCPEITEDEGEADRDDHQ